jgi:uncharacterized protein
VHSRPEASTLQAFRVVRALLATVACLYLLAAAIWYAQTKILYHPRKTLDVTPADLGLKFEPVRLALDGDRLAGWWLPSKIPHAPTLLYLHGNAGNVSANADQVRRLAGTGLSIFIFDYRGYGESTGGPPRERLVYEDAERAWTYLIRERRIQPSDVVIYGHSMGGAVAIDLASRHPDAGGLITESTFPSIVDAADGTVFAWLPLRLIVTERFDAASRIRFMLSYPRSAAPSCWKQRSNLRGSASWGSGLVKGSRGAPPSVTAATQMVTAATRM